MCREYFEEFYQEFDFFFKAIGIFEPAAWWDFTTVILEFIR